MNIINILLSTISGDTTHLVTSSTYYQEIAKEIENLEIPTFADDRKALVSDRAIITNDFKESFKKYKDNQWQNNRKSNK